MIFFETFPECSAKHCFEKHSKMIGHHARLKGVTGKSYSIYACTRANQARYSSVQVIFRGRNITHLKRRGSKAFVYNPRLSLSDLVAQSAE